MESNPTSVPPVTDVVNPAPTSLAGWFRQNGAQLVVIAAIIGAVCYFLHPLDVLLAGFGLSLIIFIHELGHFAAAKWCDVHVKTFSIGFGPALPFCSFKYGETTYKLAVVPLGGFVAMVGEGDQEGDVVGADPDPEEEKEDTNPRSFKNKPVWQRMFIISAGVIMNVLLGGVCFVATYLHGVDEVPAVASAVEPGSAAWQAGIRPGTEIKKIGSRENPWFDDIRPVVSSTSKGSTVPLEVSYQGSREPLSVAPIRQEGALFPALGILPPQALTLRSFRRDDMPPYTPGSAAAGAKAADGGPGFLPGDKIVAMTDPDDSTRVTPLAPDWNKLPGAYFDYTNRLARLAGQEIKVHVVRKGDESNTPVVVTVPPAYRKDVGLRMRMGEVTAVRRGSPAEKAEIRVRKVEGDKVLAEGDRIVDVELTEPDGKKTRFTADKVVGEGVRPLDPLKLPWELNRWADRTAATDRKVRITVLRPGERTDERVPLELSWDSAYRDEGTDLVNLGSPTAIGGLGLAYHVQAVVDHATGAAAAAGLQPNDQIVSVRFKAVDHKGKEATGDWADVKLHQWTFVDYKLQNQAPHAFEAKVKRGEKEEEVTLTAADDTNWPVWDRGLDLTPERKVQKADGLWEAIEMGADRTARSVKMIYLGLYSMASGLVSVKLMSGPITLARASYIIAGEDIWHLLLWLGLISINLAVVNFLPIPVLDGGHMVFLTYEAVRGKPAPVSVQVVLTYVGLACILALMLFVIGLDIWRLFL